MYAWMCTVLGKWDDLGMLFLNPINCIAFAVLLYYAARRYAHRTVALGITAIMASLPALLHYTECGQADVPMMMMAGAIFFCLFDWMNTGSLDSILLAGFLMGGGLFLKREGVVIFVAYGCAAVLSAWVGRGWADRRQRFKQLLLFSLVAWGWALPWFIFGRRITNWNAFSGRVSIDTIRWNDLGGALLFILNGSWHFYNAIHLPKWNILWPAFALTVVVSKSAWRRPWNFIWVAYFLQSAAIILIYLASSGRIAPGTGEEFGLERETLQILPPLWLLLAKCADEQWRIWKTGSVPEPLVGAPIQRKPVAR
jgi:4-amino-4-deoxy-L-arabinose transferase-like glycosyltransferase